MPKIAIPTALRQYAGGQESVYRCLRAGDEPQQERRADRAERRGGERVTRGRGESAREDREAGPELPPAGHPVPSRPGRGRRP